MYSVASCIILSAIHPHGIRPTLGGQSVELIGGAAEVEAEDRYFVLGSRQLEDLLGVTQITSSDYAAVKALVAGEIDSFLGFKFIRSERLAIASSKRFCMAFQKRGLGLAIGKDMMTKIDERPDKSYGWQVYQAFSMQATRVEDERMIEVGAHEA